MIGGGVLKSIIAGVMLFGASAAPKLPDNQYSVTMVRIIDADTVVVATPVPGWRAHLVLQVRLKCIDAPENRTKEGKAATKALTKMLDHFEHLILEGRVGDVDRWGRHLGKLYVPMANGTRTDIGRELVKLGYAENTCQS